MPWVTFNVYIYTWTCTYIYATAEHGNALLHWFWYVCACITYFGFLNYINREIEFITETFRRLEEFRALYSRVEGKSSMLEKIRIRSWEKSYLGCGPPAPVFGKGHKILFSQTQILFSRSQILYMWLRNRIYVTKKQGIYRKVSMYLSPCQR